MAADDRAGESVAEKTAKKKKVRQWENGEWVLENSFVTAARGQTLRKPCGVGFTRCGPVIRSESRKAHEPEHRLIPTWAFLMFGNAFWKWTSANARTAQADIREKYATR